jgi:integrase
MRTRQERAHGPYRRERRWRIVEVGADGARSTCSFASEAEAVRYRDKYNALASGRTVSAAIDEYKRSLVSRGLRATTIETYVHGLHGLLRDVDRDLALRDLTPAVARTLYARRVAERKADTHHRELTTANAWSAWCVRQGWLAANPFAAIEAVGRRTARDAKLRIDEMRRLHETAVADGSPGAVGSLLALLNGLRASEITDRVVRDVDDRGRVLWIEHAKTAAGNRWIEVPEELRTALLELCRDKLPLAPLFGRGRHWLAYHTRRLCRVAGVTEVSPHPLRRSWSVVQQEHAPVNHVARELGHADVGVTRRHYGDRGAEQRQGSARVAELLGAPERKPEGDFSVSVASGPNRVQRKT